MNLEKNNLSLIYNSFFLLTSDANFHLKKSSTATDFSQMGSDIDGEAASDYSGRTLSLSLGFVAIGAYGNDGNGSMTGHVRVYEWNRW